LDIAAPAGLVFSWLAAVAGFALALLAAVAGQAIGALIGGCGWIGVATPIDRQVWALVNQPTLNFASQSRAIGYWLGSLALPLLIAVAVIHLVPRARTLGSELVATHAAWGATVVGIAWLPLLDPVDGHLARFLDLSDLPSALVWPAPALAAVAALLPTLRLLALVRIARSHVGRAGRVALVALHLGFPCIVWATLASVVHRGVITAPTLALSAPLLMAFAVAWFGYPAPFVHRLRELDTASWIRIIIVGAVLVAVIWFAGRPLGDDRSAGLLWGRPGASNNVRPWIETMDVFTLWSSAQPADAGPSAGGTVSGPV
jgi:hypothetical protein